MTEIIELKFEHKEIVKKYLSKYKKRLSEDLTTKYKTIGFLCEWWLFEVENYFKKIEAKAITKSVHFYLTVT
ncbi:hypothetical protein MOB41_17360 [Bacillus haynesii]|uniref:hypothetical protein n=1 Tax=Bacillus haynesii TaxID=1925021 RepID=UPI002281F76B|nr:hypothetical protein [Bacillus haynesii]MCY7780171.1 hypothetical protein [Bacillus haynesii]MEC0672788.1 hypothetical protein [Bacillus haynesii]